jgi:poly [ADP-ribose] polymerase
MVTPDNNNKFYEMTWNGGTEFSVKYGRVESTSQSVSYPYGKWSTKYNEKINKGYKDVTDLVTVDVQPVTKQKENLTDIKDKTVNEFLILMKNYTDKLVSTTYSVKAESVSQKQVDKAQELIDEIGKMDARLIRQVNDKLVELYTVIPRYMSRVPDHLLPNINLGKTMVQEQDNIDAMAGQVSLLKTQTTKDAKKDKKKAQTLLDKLGISSMKECNGVPKEVEYLVKQNHGRKIVSVFELNKPAEDDVFDKWLDKQKDKSTKMLIHGTRTTSVIPILEIGLKIRPVGNYQFSGKIYGNANYFSETMQKSLGYTGYTEDRIILVYEVHVGKFYTYNGWYKGSEFELCYKELQKRGYDSLFVKAGNGLLNSEICAYNEEQARIRYIIWLK